MSCGCPRKRPLNETREKCRQKRWSEAKSVSVSHLTKHRLIKPLQRFLSETRFGHRSGQVALPPKIARLLPGSECPWTSLAWSHCISYTPPEEGARAARKALEKAKRNQAIAIARSRRSSAANAAGTRNRPAVVEVEGNLIRADFRRGKTREIPCVMAACREWGY